MKRVSMFMGVWSAALLLSGGALAGEAEFEACQGPAENAVIRAANCNLAIRLGGLSREQMIVALFNRGQAYLTTERPATALPDFDALLELEPDDKDGLMIRAITRRQLKDLDGALADLRRLEALNYQPAAQLYLNRSMVYHLKGERDKTLADLRKALELDPNNGIIKDRLWKTERLYKMQENE
ncbi:MAG TPA: hypothetical protein DCO82_03385 [Alphaproteobacteria bacterium]|jgi:tetratricopeptide (TPR) repeat protein|nr:hypothetical protein [Alphaproteobacteria bacterium]